MYAWIKSGRFELAFRLRDARGALFETPTVTARDRNRWTRLVADVSAAALRRIPAAGEPAADAGPAWPLELAGFRVATPEVGKQVIYLDDLEVEHTAPPLRSIRGEFRLSNATQIYPPGSNVSAAVLLENLSRRKAQSLNVQLAWLRADGSELTSSRASVNLPPGGTEFRSLQAVDFSQRIDEPGLYRLVARVKAAGWIVPAEFSTTIAVTPSNRGLPRGRATFFGVRTNLLREPLADQRLEIELAREIGVQLLGIETPWAAIEPKQGRLQFAALDSVVDAIVNRDIAPLIILTEPPDWLPSDPPARLQAQSHILSTLARHFGPKVRLYQALDPPGSPLTDQDVAALRQTLTAASAEAVLYKPPRDLADMLTAPGPDGVFATTGSPAVARLELETFRKRTGLRWGGESVWMHWSEPQPSSGELHDAVEVLRFYTHAAAQGVGSVVWFDLRDDTNDPSRPELMRGLARRDFSPKTPLVGLANAIGMLSGLVYAGTARGLTHDFDSALFLSGNRQVAVLFPRPNRLLPAVLAPISAVPGQIAAYDFERRMLPRPDSLRNVLVPTQTRPLFITLTTERAQRDPQLSFARPWARAPRTVLCADQAVLHVGLTAPQDLANSFIQLLIPDEAPVRSSFSARALRARAAEELEFDIPIERQGDLTADPLLVTVRLSIERQLCDLPIEVRSLARLRPLAAGASLDTTRPLAQLRESPAAPPARQDSAPALYGGYAPDRLLLALELPRGAPADSTLAIGLASEGDDDHVELLVRPPGHAWTIELTHAPPGRRLDGASVEPIELSGGRRAVRLEVPAAGLGLQSLAPGQRLLLAVRYSEPALPGIGAGRVLEWGRGLGGSLRTDEYQWVELSQE